MAFLNTDEIGDIDSLSSEQREENARNLDAIESLDDVYKTYRPLPRKYWLSSSSTSTLKAVQYANTVESIECNQLQEAIAKTDITSKPTDNDQPEVVGDKECEIQEEKDNTNKKQFKMKSTPPPVPPRPSRSPCPAAPPTPAKETNENPSTDTDREKKNIRIASGEMTKMQTDESGYELGSSHETQNSYGMNPHQSGNTARLMGDENGQVEMIASDYYAQQLAMQMSNPLYSYGGYGQSQLMSGGQSYQFQSPESEYFNHAQLQGHQLQSISNYGQYSLHGLPEGSYVQSDGSGFGQYNQFPYMTGGGGKFTDGHSREMRADSGECNCSSDESGKTESDCSGSSENAPRCCVRPGNTDTCCACDCCPINANSGCHSNRSCPDDERGFEMPESMASSMPQCRVGRGQCPAMPVKSRFSFVDVNPLRDLGMEMPCCGGMPNGPCCMMPPPPPNCCSGPAPFPCECMPPPQCHRVPCCSPPAPPCGTMPCCSPTPECCACSGNCLNIEGFLQRIRAAQQRQCCCYPQEQYCCGDDRLQSHTVYTADYQPFCGCGNKFNHFPKCDNCGSCGSRGSCASCMGCCPTACGAASGGCCQMPYDSPCCPMPPTSPGCSAPFPATCSTPCYRPCSVPCLSTPCAPPNYPTCCTDSCFANCPLNCEMPSGPLCGGSSPIGNSISKATSCNLTQCTSFS
ncbi:hypothetical protein ACLKA6_010397 [Drosophila palustris]